MFNKRIKIFSLFGFDVHVDASWAILAVLVTWTLAVGYFPRQVEGLQTHMYWLMGAAGAVGLFVSIILHELSHSVVATRYGLPMKGITLFIFGGVAEMRDEPANPKVEFLMAIVGPIASFFIAFLCAATAGFVVPAGRYELPRAVLEYLAFINLALGTFNLLPAFPLDGGRALRALLWSWKKNLGQATKISSRIGSGFAVALVLWGVIRLVTGDFIGGLWIMMIGMFLRGAAQMSYRQLVARRFLENESVGSLMTKDIVTVSPAVNLQTLVTDYFYQHSHRMYPVVENGTVLGYVTLDEVRSVPSDEWPSTSVGSVLQRCERGTTIAPQADAKDALAAIKANKMRRLLVVDGGRLVGVLSSRDILDFLTVRLELSR